MTKYGVNRAQESKEQEPPHRQAWWPAVEGSALGLQLPALSGKLVEPLGGAALVKKWLTAGGT